MEKMLILTFVVMRATAYGLIIPGIVANVFEIPANVPACTTAMSAKLVM